MPEGSKATISECAAAICLSKASIFRCAASQFGPPGRMECCAFFSPVFCSLLSGNEVAQLLDAGGDALAGFGCILGGKAFKFRSAHHRGVFAPRVRRALLQDQLITMQGDQITMGVDFGLQRRELTGICTRCDRRTQGFAPLVPKAWLPGKLTRC